MKKEIKVWNSEEITFSKHAYSRAKIWGKKKDFEKLNLK